MVIDLLGTTSAKGLRRRPVIAAAGVPGGVVSLDDLPAVVAEQRRATVAAIEAGRSPGAGQRRRLRARHRRI